MQRIELKSLRGEWWAGPLLLIVAAVCVYGAAQRHSSTLGVFGVAFLISGGAFLRATFSKQRVVVVIDREGVRDLRAGSVLIPWASIREVRVEDLDAGRTVAFVVDEEAPALKESALLRRRMQKGPGSRVLELDGVEHEAGELIAQIRDMLELTEHGVRIRFTLDS